jgi:hypothetical protein
MWAASDIADWWDEQHQAAKKELDSFVDHNGVQSVVGLPVRKHCDKLVRRALSP